MAFEDRKLLLRMRTIALHSALNIMSIKNNMEDKYEFYVISDFRPKTPNIPYNELVGQNITQFLENMGDMGFNLGVFMTAIKEISLERIKFANDDWYFINV